MKIAIIVIFSLLATQLYADRDRRYRVEQFVGDPEGILVYNMGKPDEIADLTPFGEPPHTVAYLYHMSHEYDYCDIYYVIDVVNQVKRVETFGKGCYFHNRLDQHPFRSISYYK